MAAVSSSAVRALRLYRQLLQARATTFSGDALALEKSHQAIREEFEKNRELTEDRALRKAFKVGDDTLEILSGHVIQAVKADKDAQTYSKSNQKR